MRFVRSLVVVLVAAFACSLAPPAGAAEPAERAMWVWDRPQVKALVSFASRNAVQDLFVSVPADLPSSGQLPWFRTLRTRASAAGIRVHALGSETTWIDVSDVPLDGFSFEGRLTIDGRAAAGWTARLGPAGEFEPEGQGWSALDPDGRFALRVPAAGPYRITLRCLGGERQEQILFEDLELTGGDLPWERELHTGKLLLPGLAAWDGEGPPRVVHYWKGPGQLVGVAVAVGDGEHAIEVPAGEAELRAPGESMDPDSWKVLRTITVPRGAEVRVELRPSELEGG